MRHPHFVLSTHILYPRCIFVHRGQQVHIVLARQESPGCRPWSPEPPRPKLEPETTSASSPFPWDEPPLESKFLFSSDELSYLATLEILVQAFRKVEEMRCCITSVFGLSMFLNGVETLENQLLTAVEKSLFSVELFPGASVAAPAETESRLLSVVGLAGLHG